MTPPSHYIPGQDECQLRRILLGQRLPMDLYCRSTATVLINANTPITQKHIRALIGKDVTFTTTND